MLETLQAVDVDHHLDSGPNLGRFEILSVMGEGSSARVYRAQDRASGKEVAIKAPRKELSQIQERVERLQGEAELLAHLDHPNLLPVLERGVTDEGLPWYAMPWTWRGSLADEMLRRGLLPKAQLLELGAGVLDALQYLHQRGLAHRDLQPENILITADGVAAMHKVTPELRAQEAPSECSADLFALGMTLFVGWTGQISLPLLVENLRPRALDALPLPVRRVIDRATRLEPAQRYPSARDMAR
jgi:serine/threonine protein kinase